MLRPPARVLAALLTTLVIALASRAEAQPSDVHVSRMTTARVGHAALSLGDGRVLVAGGADASGAELARAELFDHGRWHATTPMQRPRAGLRLTLLTDGRVLATGGLAARVSVREAEVWDPRTERWSDAGALAEGRADHAAVRLADGRVLVAGGGVLDLPFCLTTAELWDPRTSRWTSTGAMTEPRQGGSAVLLGDGRVLVTGSRLFAERAEGMDVYDTASGRWSPRFGPFGAIEGAVALPDGSALVLAHASPASHVADSRGASAMIFDPRTDAFTPAGTADASQWPRGASIATLPDGRVVVAGGMRWEFPSEAMAERAYAEACEGVFVPTHTVGDVYVWNPHDSHWQRDTLWQPRVQAASVMLGPSLLVIGGRHEPFWGEPVIRASAELHQWAR